MLFNSKSVLYIYIPLPIFNSDEILMSRENSKNFTYAFYKSGALQYIKKYLSFIYLYFFYCNGHVLASYWCNVAN